MGRFSSPRDRRRRRNDRRARVHGARSRRARLTIDARPRRRARTRDARRCAVVARRRGWNGTPRSVPSASERDAVSTSTRRRRRARVFGGFAMTTRSLSSMRATRGRYTLYLQSVNYTLKSPSSGRLSEPAAAAAAVIRPPSAAAVCHRAAFHRRGARRRRRRDETSTDTCTS